MDTCISLVNENELKIQLEISFVAHYLYNDSPEGYAVAVLLNADFCSMMADNKDNKARSACWSNSTTKPKCILFSVSLFAC